MIKTWLIIKREFFTRVRRRSFIIMSLLGPLLFAVFLLMPVYLSNISDKDIKTVAVIDSSHVFIDMLKPTETIKYHYLQNIDIATVKDNFEQMGYHAVLLIHPSVINTPYGAILYSTRDISAPVKENVAANIERVVQQYRLRLHGIDESALKSATMRVDLRTIKWDKSGTGYETNVEIKKMVAYIGGFLIYFFILLFGTQVMRGVIEEKTGRIVEVIATSVRPFQLMMGKIIGIALVALLQFALWISLTLVIVGSANRMASAALTEKPVPIELYGSDLMESSPSMSVPEVTAQKPGLGDDFFNTMKDINLPFLIGFFIFFFIGGYLLYGSLYAAIGSMVDTDTDTQQFALPVTLPLVLSVFVLMHTIQEPDGQLSFIFSMIPFTSPIVMMARIAFHVALWEVLLSASILVLSFVFTTWLAARIYRTGILMYGKKITYREVWKWLKYKD